MYVHITKSDYIKDKTATITPNNNNITHDINF